MQRPHPEPAGDGTLKAVVRCPQVAGAPARTPFATRAVRGARPFHGWRSRRRADGSRSRWRAPFAVRRIGSTPDSDPDPAFAAHAIVGRIAHKSADTKTDETNSQGGLLEASLLLSDWEDTPVYDTIRAEQAAGINGAAPLRVSPEDAVEIPEGASAEKAESGRRGKSGRKDSAEVPEGGTARWGDSGLADLFGGAATDGDSDIDDFLEGDEPQYDETQDDGYIYMCIYIYLYIYVHIYTMC